LIGFKIYYKENNMEKHDLVTQVKAHYGLDETTERNFFLKEEMQSIVERITGTFHEWTSCEAYMEEELKFYGWTPQQTVDTHPVLTNLHWLLSVEHGKIKPVQETTKTYEGHSRSNKSVVTLQMILENMSENLREEMTGISYDRIHNIATLQF